MIIYKITNLINNKIYIGQSINNNPNYYGGGLLIKTVIKKYGKVNFKKEILKDNIKCLTALNLYEQIFIKKYNSINKNIGYNLDNGGNGIGKHSQNTKDKMKLSQNKIKIQKSKSMKKKFEDIKYKENHKKIHQELNVRIDIRLKNSIGVKKYNDNPEIKIKKSNITKKLWNMEEYKSQQIISRKLAWQKDGYKEKMSAIHKKSKADPIRKEKFKQTIKEKLKDPEYHNQLKARANKGWVTRRNKKIIGDDYDQ